ncbi:N-methylhydantoinase A [Hyphomicrobiales bacterium]|nr:N-methylhydantoinase A [Hyphomicrobiales bacterium]CAH1695489.1 N-methylhydantoinase A [Hyphomicrobiales bacterium]
MSSLYRLGFDIGGTFTDFVLTNTATGAMELEKCLTTPDDPSRGVANGIRSLFQRCDLDGSAIEICIHATTLITNALIERRGLKTALITTRGFRDIVEMGSEVRYDLYDLFMEKPEPLISRDLRFEVTERVDSDGHVLAPVDEMEVIRLAQQLRDLGVESIAISFMHAYRNPENERRVADILARELPGMAISLSSSVAPEIREYERTSTTVANAYAKPITSTYLDKVSATLDTSGYGRRLYMMLSSGGVTDADVAKEFPIRMLESGPAAGVLAAIFYARQMRIPSLVTFDMGGTTAKVGLIKNYEAEKSGLFEFGRVARFKKGSGLPVKVPIIELIEIGAGGGSIASIDKLGLIKVGPRSAGAHPGPACYGLGGASPTVTDSNVVLGYLNPDYFLGGSMQLDKTAAARALDQHVGTPLGISAEKAAAGIYEIVNQSMVSAMKVHIAERGDDPRKFYLFAFGGAGPAHAYELARAAQMKGVIIPNGAGTASAMGLVTSAVSFDFARSLIVRLNIDTWPQIETLLREMEANGREIIAGVDAGAVGDAVTVTYQLDLRHKGQGHEMTLTVPAGLVRSGDVEAIRALFFETHESRFGHAHRHLPVQLITCRLTVSAPPPPVTLVRHEKASNDLSTALKGRRLVYFPELRTFAEAAVYDRYKLAPDMTFSGPAVIEERECTIVVGPSGTVRIDEFGSVFIDLLKEGAVQV